MIVVGIIGILAALAVPRFQTFQVKARQAEAKTNLGTIATLAEAYAVDNNGKFPTNPALDLNGPDFTTSPTSCHNTNVIGFKVSNCLTSKYSYSAISSETNFDAVGIETLKRVNPGCTVPGLVDTWNLELAGDRRRIYVFSDSAIDCTN